MSYVTKQKTKSYFRNAALHLVAELAQLVMRIDMRLDVDENSASF